jgi:tetratricopeptide (TPR) repeat protein
MNPYSINPPESEVIFEELCLAVLKRHWNRPGLERFGKKGEEQFGVDIFDTLGESPMYGAQCKLKESTKSLEPAEIREEVEKAESFPAKLDHYAIMTTGKVSGTAQLTIQQINQKHRTAGSFTVELFTWDKITKLLRQYPEIEQQFYGGLHSEEVAEVKVKLEAIHSAVAVIGPAAAASAKTEIDALIDEARERIKPGEAQIAITLLHRVQRLKRDQLTDWHRFRIYTNLGAANLILGKGNEAARNFLDAAPLRPEDELAVANEVLAYHLLLQDQTTRERAEAAVIRFPNATRLRSLLIQAAKHETPYAGLLADTPEHMRSDAEVASALSRRAMMAGLIETGIEHAKAAVADKPKWAQAHLLLAQAHFARVVMAERTIKPLKAEVKEKHLESASSAADAAIAIADTDDLAYVRAQAFALKTDIAHVQGRKEDAAQFARDAFAADASELQSQMAIAQAAFSRNDVDEGIRILEQANLQSKSMPNVCFMLGQALMGRGKDEDIARAFTVFSTANIANIKQDLVDPLTLGAVRALVREGRFQEVSDYLKRPEVKGSPTLVVSIQAYSALKQSQETPCSQTLDEALASRRPEDTCATIDFLARTLLEAGRLNDALPLLQELFRAQTPNFDVGLLFTCAGRLKKDEVILETCQELYDRGVRDWEFQEFESQYLEEYDPMKAIGRLEEFIRNHPDHRTAKLRLAIVAMRYGKENLVQLTEEVMPLPEDLSMRYAVAAIQALQWQNRETFAVDYAYRVLRAHTEEIEAHKAYLASLSPGVRPDIPATMEEVAVGSAVQYTEDGANESEWVVIEDTDKPSATFEEIPSSAELAKKLLGKRVGETLVLAKSPVKDRVGTVNQILSKYTRRFQAVGEKMEIKFGDQTVIRTMRFPKPETLTAADLQPILDSVKRHSEAVAKLREIYKTEPVTIFMYGDQLGHSAYEGLFDLAVSETGFVRCAHPQMDLFVDAMNTLGTKSTVVLDLIALGTLRLLGVTRQVLTSGGARFVLTPATFTALQQLRAQSRFATAHGTMHYQEGQHYFTQTTQEQSDREKASFDEWMQTVEQNTTVQPVAELAAFNPERRETLEKLFGRDGLESAVFALTPGNILWTDDLAVAEVTKSELGTERVWSQVVIESLANRGLIDRSLADECHAKLLGFGYQSTHFTGGTIAAALQVSNGSVDRFPMKQAIEAFCGTVANNRIIALRQLAEFVLRLLMEPMLPETKCVALEGLLDTFPKDSATTSQLLALRDQCARLMILNPLEQRRFVACFDRWMQKTRIIHPFITG